MVQKSENLSITIYLLAIKLKFYKIYIYTNKHNTQKPRARREKKEEIRRRKGEGEKNRKVQLCC